MLSPLDDLPVHQVAEAMATVGTSDRNFYDRHGMYQGPDLVVQRHDFRTTSPDAQYFTAWDDLA